MQNKTHSDIRFFNLIRFYKWGIGLNTWKIISRLSTFIIKRESKFLDEYFKKRSLCYRETFRDFHDTKHGGSPTKYRLWKPRP